jgi:hypothetical protein
MATGVGILVGASVFLGAWTAAAAHGGGHHVAAHAPTAAGFAAGQASPADAAASAAVLPAGWTWYRDPAGRYAFGVPPAWHVAGPCPVGQAQSGEGTEVRLAPHDDACGVDAANDDIVVDVLPAASAPPQLVTGASTCSSSQPVTVGGVAGARIEHVSSACSDYPAEWYQFDAGGMVMTIAFDSASFCDFSTSPAPAPAYCAGTRGDFTSTLDALVRQTLTFRR